MKEKRSLSPWKWMAPQSETVFHATEPASIYHLLERSCDKFIAPLAINVVHSGQVR